jgi:phosphoribosylanthranilate isomerase
MIVKICGITDFSDGLISIEAGAEMLGFNFYPPSPRYISPGDCKKITLELRRLHPQIKLVGVFVNSPVEHILDVLRDCNLDLAQLSGDEPPAILWKIKLKAIKACDRELQTTCTRF